MTVAVDGGAVTNYAIADADIVTGADMVGALNAGFDRQQRWSVTVAGSTGAALTFTAALPPATAPPTSWSPLARSSLPRLRRASTPTARSTKTNATAQTVDEIVSGINANTSLTGKVKASNDNGKVSIQNLSTTT